MFHKNRVWCVTPKETAEEVARLLTETTWTLCTAIEIGGYLFLNDATCEDGAQEYAAVKKPAAPGDPYLQVESITMSWCSLEKASDLVRRTIAGEFDRSDFAGVVVPRLESAAEHKARYCHRCA